MRRDSRRSRIAASSGVTLVELVVAIVIVTIIIAALIFFVTPLRQGIDITARATLTDAADNALQRMGRDVRLALPNSVRVDGTGRYLEFLPIVTAGRYRVEGYGSGAPTGTPCDGAAAPDSDALAFGAVDSCFKSIGTLGATLGAAYRLVLSNYGPGFLGQNAYEPAGPAANWRALDVTLGTPTAGSHDRIRITSVAPFDRTLHDSPGRRYYVISEAVTYWCDLGAGELRRRTGYGFPTAQALPADGDLVTRHVTRCVFEYQPAVAPAIGLLTLRLGLAVATGGGTETVELVHAVHVRNVP